MISACPTCGSTDRDVFLPIVATVMRCDNPWHEDRIIKKPTKKSGEAAARQSQVFMALKLNDILVERLKGSN